MKIKKFLRTYITRFRRSRQNKRDLKSVNQHSEQFNADTSDLLEYVDDPGAAEPDNQEKLSDFLRNSPLADGELALGRDKSLPVLMDQISDNARQRGLTPEILEDLLHDD